MSSALEVDNLEEAKKLVRDLRQKTRAQAQQIMAWRKAYKMQVSTCITIILSQFSNSLVIKLF